MIKIEFKRAFKKIGIFYLASSFVLLNASEQVFSAAASNQSPAMPTLPFIVSPESISLPEEWGTIQETYTSRASSKQQKLVIYLQDAHANEGAQRSIQRMIRFFEERYSLRLVLLEGGSGKLDSLFFKSFPERKIKEKILDHYLESAELTGAEVAAIGSYMETDFYGIEDQSLYLENKQAFLESINQTSVLRELEKIENNFEISFKNSSEKFKVFYDKYKLFHSEKLGFVEYLRALRELIPAENSHLISDLFPELHKILAVAAPHRPDDELRVEMRKFLAQSKGIFNRLSRKSQMEMTEAIQLYQTGKIDSAALLKKIQQKAGAINIQIPDSLRPLVHRLEKLDSIESFKLFDELRELEIKLSELLGSKEEKDLFSDLCLIQLFKRFASLEISHTEWEEIQSSKETFLKSREIKPQREKWEEFLKPCLKFYELAKKRDKVLFENMISKMNEKNVSLSLVVTGGFHSKGITEKLKASNTSFILISPRIETISDESHYLKVMTGKRSFMKYFKNSLWEALAQDYTARIAASQELRGRIRPVFKNWRDQIIQNLMDEGNVEKSTSQTIYLDAWMGEKNKSREELQAFVDDYFQRLRSLVNKRINILSKGLKLKFEGKITENQLAHLIKQINSLSLSQLSSEIALIPGKSRGLFLLNRSEIRHELLDVEHRLGDYMNKEILRASFNGQAPSDLDQHKIPLQRLNSLIIRQAGSEENALCEWVSNAIGKSIGRYGMGFLQSLRFVEEDDATITILTKKKNHSMYKVSIYRGGQRGDWDIRFKVSKVNDSQLTGQSGTEMKLEWKKKLPRKRLSRFRRVLKSKFGLQREKPIHLNNRVLNPLEGYFFINSGPVHYRYEQDPVKISFDDKSFTVRDNGIGMDEDVVFNKLLLPRLGLSSEQLLKTQTREEVSRETALFYKAPGSFREKSKMLVKLLVLGVEVQTFEIEGLNLPKELVLDLPSSTDITLSRNRVAIDEVMHFAMEGFATKLATVQTIHQDALINGFIRAVAYLDEKNNKQPQKLMDGVLNILKKWLQKQEGVILPNRLEFYDLETPQGVRFLDEALLYAFDPSRIPGAKEITAFRSGTLKRAYQIPFKKESELKYLEWGDSLIIDKDYYEEQKEFPSQINLALNFYVGYGPTRPSKGHFIPESQDLSEKISKQQAEQRKKEQDAAVSETRQKAKDFIKKSAVLNLFPDFDINIFVDLVEKEQPDKAIAILQSVHDFLMPVGENALRKFEPSFIQKLSSKIKNSIDNHEEVVNPSRSFLSENDAFFYNSGNEKFLENYLDQLVSLKESDLIYSQSPIFHFFLTVSFKGNIGWLESDTVKSLETAFKDQNLSAWAEYYKVVGQAKDNHDPALFDRLHKRWLKIFQYDRNLAQSYARLLGKSYLRQSVIDLFNAIKRSDEKNSEKGTPPSSPDFRTGFQAVNPNDDLKGLPENLKNIIRFLREEETTLVEERLPPDVDPEWQEIGEFEDVSLGKIQLFFTWYFSYLEKNKHEGITPGDFLEKLKFLDGRNTTHYEQQILSGIIGQGKGSDMAWLREIGVQNAVTAIAKARDSGLLNPGEGQIKHQSFLNQQNPSEWFYDMYDPVGISLWQLLRFYFPLDQSDARPEDLGWFGQGNYTLYAGLNTPGSYAYLMTSPRNPEDPGYGIVFIAKIIMDPERGPVIQKGSFYKQPEGNHSFSGTHIGRVQTDNDPQLATLLINAQLQRVGGLVPHPGKSVTPAARDIEITLEEEGINEEEDSSETIEIPDWGKFTLGRILKASYSRVAKDNIAIKEPGEDEVKLVPQKLQQKVAMDGVLQFMVPHETPLNIPRNDYANKHEFLEDYQKVWLLLFMRTMLKDFEEKGTEPPGFSRTWLGSSAVVSKEALALAAQFNQAEKKGVSGISIEALKPFLENEQKLFELLTLIEFKNGNGENDTLNNIRKKILSRPEASVEEILGNTSKGFHTAVSEGLHFAQLVNDKEATAKYDVELFKENLPSKGLALFEELMSKMLEIMNSAHVKIVYEAIDAAFMADGSGKRIRINLHSRNVQEMIRDLGENSASYANWEFALHEAMELISHEINHLEMFEEPGGHTHHSDATIDNGFIQRQEKTIVRVSQYLRFSLDGEGQLFLTLKPGYEKHPISWDRRNKPLARSEVRLISRQLISARPRWLEPNLFVGRPGLNDLREALRRQTHFDIGRLQSKVQENLLELAENARGTPSNARLIFERNNLPVMNRDLEALGRLFNSSGQEIFSNEQASRMKALVELASNKKLIIAYEFDAKLENEEIMDLLSAVRNFLEVNSLSELQFIVANKNEERMIRKLMQKSGLSEGYFLMRMAFLKTGQTDLISKPDIVVSNRPQKSLRRFKGTLVFDGAHYAEPVKFRGVEVAKIPPQISFGGAVAALLKDEVEGIVKTSEWVFGFANESSISEFGLFLLALAQQARAKAQVASAA